MGLYISSETSQEIETSDINTLPLSMQLILSAAAPFRIATLNNWFLLHDFGNIDALTDESFALLSTSLRRDFGAVCRESTFHSVRNINSYSLLFEGNHSLELRAYRCGVLAHLLISACDVGYIAKDEVIVLMKNSLEFIKTTYWNWDLYGTDIIKGHRCFELSISISPKRLEHYVKVLLHNKTSPWKIVTIK
ncbi:MAG: hypothetical protein ACK5LL_07265 [Suipraeoptans sp.]